MYVKSILGIFFAILIYHLHTKIQNVLYPEEVLPSTFQKDVWWSARNQDSIDDKIRPFTISTPDHALNHLKNRLKGTKFPVTSLKDSNFQYGFNIEFLKNVTSYWLNHYDWNSRLKFLNSFPHFKTYISGLDIHFIHVEPDLSAQKSLTVVPILLLHGWPGSVREFYELIPLLTKPRKNQDFVFEVIAPSLPGYGYSEGTTLPGMETAQMSVLFKKLMEKLGHKKFYIHGGDWGSLIGNDMAILDPENVLGLHSTMCESQNYINFALIFLGSFWPRLVVDKEHEHRLYPFPNTVRWFWLESGYFHQQATKPDTIGIALSDSPVGLSAYILEKFSTWTNPDFRNLPDGGLTKKFQLDALLDNIMIYWTTDSILTSMRLYSEYFSAAYRSLGLDRALVKVPTVCAQFPHEIFYLTPEMLQRKYKKLIKISEFKDGGHFAAFELPDVVAEDLWSSIALFREEHGKQSQPPQNTIEISPSKILNYS